MKRVTIIMGIMLMSIITRAQGTESTMESSGKIYVVLAVVLAIYAGLMLFLTAIERKLSNLERQIKE